jgi:hypothetical protein
VCVIERRRSMILPPYMRRSKSIETLLPILDLRGLSTGNFLNLNKLPMSQQPKAKWRLAEDLAVPLGALRKNEVSGSYQWQRSVQSVGQ